MHKLTHGAENLSDIVQEDEGAHPEEGVTHPRRHRHRGYHHGVRGYWPGCG